MYSKRPGQSYIVQVKESKFILDCPVQTATPSEQVDPDKAGELDPLQRQPILGLV